jgi:hypothetical protein
VEAWRPVVTTGASDHHRNHCYSGVGVTHMEMWGDLLRWNATDARWYSLDNCYRGPYPGATTLACDTYYNCYHPFTTRTYKGSAGAYSVVKGIGYFATDYSDTITTTCD